LGPNLGVFLLEQTRHVGVAKSEHPMLTNGEIIKNSNLCDRNSPTSQTDRQTDDMRRNTPLCTKVHRVVKSVLLVVLNETNVMLCLPSLLTLACIFVSAVVGRARIMLKNFVHPVGF